MSGRSDVKDDLLHTAAESWSDASPEEATARVNGPGDPAELRRFLCHYYRHVATDELSARGPAEICGPALTHRDLAALRPQGRANVQAFTPSRDTLGWDTGRSVVEIVTDDAPFLVSSVINELERHGLGVHLVVHPQLRVARDLTGRLLEVEPTESVLVPSDESWMHIEIDRQSDPTVLKQLAVDLERVLADVRHVDEDSGRMRRQALRLADDLAAATDSLTAGGVPAHEVPETVELLRWAADRNFVFMGYREYDLVTAAGAGPDGEEELALRPLPGTGLGLMRMDTADSTSFAALPPRVRAKAREPHALVLTKANSRSTVDRHKYLDYLGVKKFDATGAVVGERRFLGLFTPQAAATSITQIPILRRKLTEVLDRAGLHPDSHDGRDVLEAMEGLPREELFQTPVAKLHEIVTGVLRLRERRGTRLFLRHDDYGRYVSCLVYLHRDRFSTQVRERVQGVLRDAFGGASTDHSVMVTSSPLARLHVVVRAPRGATLPEVAHADLQAEVVRAARSWDDDLFDGLTDRFGPDRGTALYRAYHQVLPDGYKADVPAETAVDDLARIDRLGPDGLAVNLYRPSGADTGTSVGEWRFKVYCVGEPVSLSRVLPLLEHMGVEVVDERPYGISRPAGEPGTATELERIWVYDFGLARIPTADQPETRLTLLFEEAFTALWTGQGESDRFNALVLRAGLTWRQLTILRAYAKYLRQTGSTFSPAYLADVLVANTHVASLLVRLFESRFDPRYDTGREERSAAITEEINGELDQVASLDHDRILRSFLAAIQATLRTNYFRTDPDTGAPRPYTVLKLDPRRIPGLPAPLPRLEMFVYSPRVEGVHLRFGTVARGGLRWSDRPEDFRTEILGLVKAQMVKNAVIVPTGAKGGFVCKRLPEGGDREAVQAEVVACYEQFIGGLLDVTDNLVNGRTEHPAGVVRYDSADSYLVVAADKGTATFSDIANRIAAERGFWLGDAFASGGSVGYDHKAMGITARGAWESVRYHFREMGVDVQRDDITVVGVGDMSGDVFGNGMLLSRHIKLVAAFDHRHIFLDPDPDPESGFAERQRLFALPRSSWADYDRALVSRGGGVHPRTAKSIPLSPQVRAALGIDEGVTSATPFELISHILRAPVDLLWNGGIGTYVKASTESHAAAGDKTNDPVRVDATELRCVVVGEGGNLGLTQAARIELALNGGRVNTDFIDNSAGVDTSDHEVNIKIMLDRAVRAGELTAEDRDRLFLGMTDEVAELVLRDNYDQNVVLAAARKQATGLLHVHARYMRTLERSGRLERALEFLPDERAIAARRSAGGGLTGPEFATLIAYTKISLEDEIIDSDLPEQSYLRDTLVEYFPTPLRERFAAAMPEHPLWREIIVTSVVNELVNSMGTTFAFRINEETGATAAEIARAYLVVREVFDLRGLWRAVEELDHEISVDTQLALLLEARKLAERASRWLLQRRGSRFAIDDEVAFFGAGVAEIMPKLPQLLQGRDLEAYEDRKTDLLGRDVPAELAERVAGMVAAYSTFDLVATADRTGWPLAEVAGVYFDLAVSPLQISRLRERIIALPREDRWSTMARSALRDELYAAHAALASDIVLSGEPGESPERLRAKWAGQNEAAVSRARHTLSDIWESERFDLATLSVAVRAVRSLVDATE